MVCSVGLLALVEADLTGTQRHDEQQAADDREALEEQERVVDTHRVAELHRPERIEVDAVGEQDEDEHGRARLGPVADEDAYNERQTEDIEEHIGRGEVELERRGEHEDGEDAAEELHELLGAARTECRQAAVCALLVRLTLDKQQ